MSKKKYNCELAEEPCEYAGNRYYNYGFIQGNKSFCRYKKRWVDKMEECPMKDSERRLQKRMEEEAHLTAIVLQSERDADGFIKNF